MSTTEQNLETVRSIYAAFGKGDVPAILELLSDDVAWDADHTHTGDIPWLRPGHGKAHVVEFFQTLGAGAEFHAFEPIAILGNDLWVTTILRVEFTVRATGKRVVEPSEVHIFGFGPDGKVSSFRHSVDTRQHAEAAGVL